MPAQADPVTGLAMVNALAREPEAPPTSIPFGHAEPHGVYVELGPRTRTIRRRVTSYRPMTLADLGRRLVRVDDAKNRWKPVSEFLEEYRWESGVPAQDLPAAQ